MKKIIIVGSSRKNGNTNKIVNEIIKKSNWEIIDLNDYNISPYDYLHENKTDDFIKLVSQIIEKYDILIFATPVYWYSMSGIMKNFIDRFTDLLTIEKETGRMLRGKHMAVITNSSGDHLNELFWIPFEKTAEYLGMKFITGIHTLENEIKSENLNRFINLIEKTT